MGNPQCTELPSSGSSNGAVADLNFDGYDDLLLGMEKSGNAGMRNAYIYYGSPEGLSERNLIRVPAHRCTASAIGDFNGDGRHDVALITEDKLRIFYQSEYGFEPMVFVDFDIGFDQIGAADLDRDGYSDLVAFSEDGPPRIYWGGPDGIDLERRSDVLIGDGADGRIEEEQMAVSEEEGVSAASPLPKVIDLGGRPHLFVPFAKRVYLVPVDHDRTFDKGLTFACRNTFSVAVGDVTGSGHPDLVFVGRDHNEQGECSWIYWGGPDGFSEARRTALPSMRACDVAVGDLNGNGCDDVAICQKQNDESYSVESLVYRGTREGIDPEPIHLATHGARRVFVARTSDDPNPQLIFVNQLARNAIGDVDSTIYYGGADGFSTDRVCQLPGRGASTAAVCDTTDNGWPDVILANSSENAMNLDPGSYLFLGGPEGFSREPDLVFPTGGAGAWRSPTWTATAGSIWSWHISGMQRLRFTTARPRASTWITPSASTYRKGRGIFASRAGSAWRT